MDLNYIFQQNRKNPRRCRRCNHPISDENYCPKCGEKIRSRIDDFNVALRRVRAESKKECTEQMQGCCWTHLVWEAAWTMATHIGDNQEYFHGNLRGTDESFSRLEEAKEMCGTLFVDLMLVYDKYRRLKG